MKHLIKRFFSIGAYEKEEAWLNAMSAKGMQFVETTGFSYVFEEGHPNEYIYRLELLNHSVYHPESQAYLNFLQETGIEHVATFRNWVYLRKKASEGPFDLYTDRESKMNLHQRVNRLANAISVPVLTLALFYFCLAYMNEFNILFSVWSGIFLFAAIFVQLLMIPNRRKLHRLKKLGDICE